MELVFRGSKNLKRYNGTDPVTNQTISADIGNIVDVSEVKGAQLLSDFPGAWEDYVTAKVVETPKKKGK